MRMARTLAPMNYLANPVKLTSDSAYTAAKPALRVSGQKHILLVEDNTADAELCISQLKAKPNNEYISSHRDSIGSALDFLSQRTPDVILLDLSLPDSFGLDGLLQIRRAFPYIPIIILTGLQDDELALKSIALGAQDYLVKGSYSEQLLDRSVSYAIERMETAKKLFEKDRKIGDLVSRLQGMTYLCEVGENWRMVRIDEGCMNLTGYSMRSLTDKVCFDELILKEHRLSVKVGVKSSLSKLEQLDITFPIKCGTKHKWIWMQGIGTSVRDDGTILVEGIMLDITEKVEVEQAKQVFTNKLNEEVKQRTAELLDSQKKLEEKNKEMLDSIAYAQRLQQAILPSEGRINKHLEDSFTLYRPKDILAGDFYWLEALGDMVYFAVGDCTGHGVPGALVSVVCATALSNTVIEDRITEPGRILDRTRDLVMQTFGRSDQEIKDGMDISLCALDRSSGRLEWAGANNGLWIARRDNIELEILASDKQPIGKYGGQEKPFTNHKLTLEKGDTLYIMSDGYMDQFGGPNGKKFMASQLRQHIQALHGQPLSQQKSFLQETFDAWKRDLEQIDDVCIMGVRYS